MCTTARIFGLGFRPRQTHNNIVRQKYGQVSPRTVLFRCKQEGISSTDSTSCVFSFSHIATQQTYATLHSRTTCHYKRIFSTPHQSIALTLQAQTDIIMWRSFVLLLIAQPTKLSRSMESFRPQAPQYCSKYDVSLTRIAVGIYTSDSDDLLTFAAVDLPFPVNNEARRQNTMEFLAIIFGLLLCWRTQKSDFHYNLHGDSMSSLVWATKDRVNSKLARRGNIVYTTLSMHLDAKVAVTTHIPGKLNIIFDGLSRLLSPADLGLDISLQYNASDDATLLQFLKLCDLDATIDTIADTGKVGNKK